ncbi:MAG: hypothetical protein JXB38_02400 [Anaerolineales bacterium]|nr:hypothetical protein [Anaerolineales bacterium]
MSKTKGKWFYSMLVVGMLLLLLLAGCQSAAVEENEPASDPQEAEEVVSEPDSGDEGEEMDAADETSPAEEAPDEDLVGTIIPVEPETTRKPPVQNADPMTILVATARQDLAERLDIPVEAIRVQSLEAVEWPDAGLGCPVAGLDYAQVITPGYQIMLKTEDGRVFDYHSNMRGAMVLCSPDGEAEAVQVTPVIPAEPKIQDGEPWVPVD